MNQPDKAHFLERVSREMDEDSSSRAPRPEEVAACCRILAREGHESVRRPGPARATGRNRGGRSNSASASEAKTENMVLVDDDLETLGGRANGRFHVWIYRKRRT
jgi:hypothetical protein